MKSLSYVLIAGLFGSSSAFATGTTESGQPPSPQSQTIQYGGGAADLLNQTKTPESLQKPAGGMKVSMNCTDANGKQYTQGDADYLRCMEDYKLKKTAPGTTTNSKSATGFNFKIK